MILLPLSSLYFQRDILVNGLMEMHGFHNPDSEETREQAYRRVNAAITDQINKLHAISNDDAFAKEMSYLQTKLSEGMGEADATCFTSVQWRSRRRHKALTSPATN